MFKTSSNTNPKLVENPASFHTHASTGIFYCVLNWRRLQMLTAETGGVLFGSRDPLLDRTRRQEMFSFDANLIAAVNNRHFKCLNQIIDNRLSIWYLFTRESILPCPVHTPCVMQTEVRGANWLESVKK